MKVGIWGLYDKGNFGDDLMAGMFYKFLLQKGYEPILYNSSEYLNNELNSVAISNIEKFVSSVDIVVIGGGGMLVNNSILKFLLKRSEFKFEYSFYKLFNALVKYKKRIVPISIGGSNASVLNNYYKKVLFSQRFTDAGTVRLISDLKLVEKDIFNYFPDVVLSTARFFPCVKEPNKTKRRIVLNLKKKTSEKLILEFKKRDIFKYFDVYSFSSHATSKKDYGLYEFELPSKTFKFNVLSEALNFLSNSDLVISSKLHVGVTALSYNIPFISYNGPQKAKEFLIDYNKSEWIDNDSVSVVNKLLDFEQNFSDCSFNENNAKLSYNHFNELEKILTL